VVRLLARVGRWLARVFLRCVVFGFFLLFLLFLFARVLREALVGLTQRADLLP
jgi:hypothetical protein